MLKLISCVFLGVCSAYVYAGERPYEMVWAERNQDARPPLVAFTNAAGWRIATSNAMARLERSTEQLLFGEAVAKLTYRATGPRPHIMLTPPAPLNITNAFDAVTCWFYGLHNRYRPEPDKPAISITLHFKDSNGESFAVQLARRLNFREWFMCHKRLEPQQAERVRNGGALVGISVGNGYNTEDQSVFINSLAVFQEAFDPLTFEARPQRGVRVFPACDPGVNSGAGRLPFPNTPLTIAPRDSAPNTTRSVKTASGRYHLAREGDDGLLEARLPSRLGTWDDLKMRWGSQGEWVNVAIGGGLYFVSHTTNNIVKRAELEDITIWSDGHSVTYAGRLSVNGRHTDAQIRFSLVGKALVIDLQADGGDVKEVRFGATKGFSSPRLIPLPYYTYGYNDLLERPLVIVSGSIASPLFFFAHMDWTQSNATKPFAGKLLDDGVFPSNGGTIYESKTDGKRNFCCERFVMALSPRFEDVLPNIPNPQSPWKFITGTRVWRPYGARNRELDADYWRRIHRWGMTQMVVTDHETGWRDGNESFTFRTAPAPQKGGDDGQLRYARIMQDELGFIYGPYNNFTDFAPVNAFWDSDLVSRTQDNQLQHAWERCYAPKPARAVEFCAMLSPKIQKKFGFSTAYCDVHTAVTPWSRVDFDARVPGAGTFASVFYAYGEIMLLQKEAWNGPVYSEGKYHFMYCGLTDGNYAQDRQYRLHQNPWLVDFDLRCLHDLCCNFGMGDLKMFYSKEKMSDDPNAARDRFLAATVAFGHPGFLLSGTYYQLRSYYMIQALACYYTQAAADKIYYAGADGILRETSDALADESYKRSQLVTCYNDGTVTAANGHPSERMKVVVAGASLDLPPNGYWGRSGDGAVKVFSGDVNGHRADLAVSPSYTYIDGRGEFVRFDEGASSGIAICRALTDDWVEVLLYQNSKAGFPYVFSDAVALDATNGVMGTAEVLVSKGLSYVQPVKGAFSYRMRRNSMRK
ncbi:MAG: hypothetical protein PHU80_07240 [Kiritimatiellae bacterium]|nr:hypothetical protein [Kiritimatiellia bacterium]